MLPTITALRAGPLPDTSNEDPDEPLRALREIMSAQRRRTERQPDWEKASCALYPPPPPEGPIMVCLHHGHSPGEGVPGDGAPKRCDAPSVYGGGKRTATFVPRRGHVPAGSPTLQRQVKEPIRSPSQTKDLSNPGLKPGTIPAAV